MVPETPPLSPSSGGYAVAVLCVLGVCSGCSRAGGVFCVLTLASSRVQFRSTSQDALGFSFVFCSFRIYQKNFSILCRKREKQGALLFDTKS